MAGRSEAFARIRLVIFDVDGTLTRRDITYDTGSNEYKSFSAADGLGLVALAVSGIQTGIITGRESDVVARRARDLRMSFCLQRIADKAAAVREQMDAWKLSRDQVAFVGDDLNDLPAFAEVGMRVAVADAANELKRQAHYVTRAPGGGGAAREVAERILRPQGLWRADLAYSVHPDRQ